MEKTNDGAPGIDGVPFGKIKEGGIESFLDDIQKSSQWGTYQPSRYRIKELPKAGGKTRKPGIPTIRDRAVQAALKLILEPVFAADFQEGSFALEIFLVPGSNATIWQPLRRTLVHLVILLCTHYMQHNNA